MGPSRAASVWQGAPMAQEMKYVYVDYDEAGEPWHEHLAVIPVLPGCPDGRWVIYTADDMLYEEILAVPPLRGLRWGQDRPLLPPGLGVAHGLPVYRFRQPLRKSTKDDLMVEALEMVRADREAYAAAGAGPAHALPALPAPAGVPGALASASAPGSAAPPAARPASSLAPGGPSGPPGVVGAQDPGPDLLNKVMVVAFPHATLNVGDPMEFRPGDLYLAPYVLVKHPQGTVVCKVIDQDEYEGFADKQREVFRTAAVRGIVTPPAEGAEIEDVRTLPVKYESTGERYRNFDEAACLMTEEPFDEQDWPIEGPRSALWWIKSTRRLGLTPLARHSRWVAESGVAASDRSIYEHEVISHCVELASTVDQINIGSLACFEQLIRRLQLIEEAHVMSPANPSYDGAEHWLGNGRRKAGVLVFLQLARHVAGKVREETEVAKERRKAREERRLVPPRGQKGGKKDKEKEGQ